MKTYTQDELNEIIRKHGMWLRDEVGGVRADLRFARLESADLRFARLESADLEYANLESADLRSANLRSADLLGANLRSADLRFADLESADLRSADLESAKLGYANLESADLRSANLRGADLESAKLRYANLESADLRSANLESANLRSANLSTSHGLAYSQIAFSGHGECGRMLTAVVVNGSAVYFCGCFSGSYDGLMKYIDEGKEDLKESRMLAARFVKAALELSIERGTK